MRISDWSSDVCSSDLSDSYFAVLTAIETLVSAKAEETAVKRQLDQAEKRLEVGLAPITDVHEAQSRYDTARAATIAAPNAYDNAGENLTRSEERRVGKGGVSTCSYRWMPFH